MRGISVAAASLVLAGCATPTGPLPLVFGESLTFGVSIGTSTADQGVDMTLGFKSRDIAVVPVISADGKSIESVVEGKTGGKTTDSYSVLGQFNNTTEGTGAKVGLGKFFATGTAAAVLADGFAKSMGSDSEQSAQAQANTAKVNAAKGK